MNNEIELFFTIKNRTFTLDFEKIKELCLVSKNDILIDSEITDVSSLDEETEDNDFVSQKVIKETKYCNTQADVLMTDLVKTIILKLFECDDTEKLTISQKLAFNTGLHTGIIKEI